MGGGRCTPHAADTSEITFKCQGKSIRAVIASFTEQMITCNGKLGINQDQRSSVWSHFIVLGPDFIQPLSLHHRATARQNSSQTAKALIHFNTFFYLYFNTLKGFLPSFFERHWSALSVKAAQSTPHIQFEEKKRERETTKRKKNGTLMERQRQ